MIITNYIHITIFLTFLILAIYVLNKNRRVLLNQLVSVLLLFFSIWSFSLSIIHNPLISKETAEVFAHVGNLAGIGYGIFIFLSICVFTKLVKLNKMIYILLAMYFVAILIFQIVTDFVSITIKDQFDLWTIEYNNSQMYLLYSLVHNSLVVSSLVLLIKFIKGKSDPIQKKQSIIILVSGLISFLLASLNIFLPKIFPNIQLPLLVDLCMSIFAIGIAYSIIKYDLFEITPKIILNQIINILPVGLLIADTNNQILRVNVAMLEITKRSKNEFENRPVQEIIQKLIGSRLDFDVNNISSKQIKIVTSSKESTSALLSYKSIIDNNKRSIGSILIVQDVETLVSTQKELNELNHSLESRVEERTIELIKAKEKAEESSLLKTLFLNNISHEIRTPLNAISGFTGLLVEPGYTKEEQKHFADNIQLSSKRLIEIVTNILTISSLEAKQEICSITKVSINQLIVDLYTEYKNPAKNSNILLTVKKQLSDNESVIFTDKVKLFQILTKLLSNALLYTHEGFVEFGYSLKNNNVEFYVRDSGIGIDPSSYEKIFERFGQAEKPKERLYGGAGIGLSIAKGYTELLGGEIWVHSEPGKGSTFYFTLPYKPVDIGE